MTYKEKLQQEHPEMVNKKGECWNYCPHDYGYCENPPIEHCRQMNCNDCWGREIPSTEPTCDVIKETYDQGLNDAWELFKKVLEMPNDIICEHILEGDAFNPPLAMVKCLTPQGVLAKLKAYEESQVIKVGDVVVHKETGMKFLIITHEKCDFYKFGVINLEEMILDKIANNASAFKKTGKHIDIQQILSQIGE